MKRIQQPKIEVVGNKTHMDCLVCGIHKVIAEENAKFVYLEINKFRREHEHIVRKAEVIKIIQKS